MVIRVPVFKKYQFIFMPHVGEVGINLLNSKTLQKGLEIVVVASTNFAKLLSLTTVTTTNSKPF